MTAAQDHSAGVPPAMAWLAALREPARTLQWTLADWQRVVRLSRRLRLLGRLAEAVDAAGLLDQVPAPVRRHLLAEQRLSRTRSAAMVWTIERVAHMLSGISYPMVLLKGAAYIGQDLPIAAGRLPSDLDILVPRAHLADAQRRLLHAGWMEVPLDAHDQRYYHEWSHEVPPMTHPLMALELDLHHNILPPLARTHVDADTLLATLSPSRWPGWQVLSPVDQVLHSAVHLFQDPEPVDRLRDLVDMDGLVRHFAALQPDFYRQLGERATALGLAPALALCRHFTASWLGTPWPDGVPALPSLRQRAWRQVLHTLLWPTEPDDRSTLSKDAAAQLALLRYHQGRLPMRLLLPHLWHKWRTQHTAAAEEPPPAG